MGIQKTRSRRVASSVPKIKPKRKMKRHKWGDPVPVAVHGGAYTCLRCGHKWQTEHPFEEPPKYGCVPSLGTKPRRKEKIQGVPYRHRWRLERYWAFRSTFRCSRCRQNFVPNLLSVYEVNWNPPIYGCTPAPKDL